MLAAVLLLTGALLAAVAPLPAAGAPAQTLVAIDANAATRPFPHFWERMFGSGRAALVLRASYQRDLRMVKAATGVEYVRFHGILHDEVGMFDLDERGNAVYNFSYVDQIYDALLDAGVKPFVELSFMPQRLAADPNKIFGFWYKPNIAPPKDYAQWDALIGAFARHLVERYGIDEIATWYFEVWNEPNAGFWGGEPYQPTYFELYDHTARALKRVDARLRVGGPATAQAAWAGDFIRHCAQRGVPVDFVSSHVYANDSAQDVFASNETIPPDKMTCRAVRKVHDEVRQSPLPDLPLFFTEYNASFANEPNITDTDYMAAWLATTISQCDGLVEAMAQWTFSDVFEENGVIKSPFHGGFGIVAEHGLAKPAFNAYALLHDLGTARLPVASDAVLATRRTDGALVVALWNYAPPDATGTTYTPNARAGTTRRFRLAIGGLAGRATAQLRRVDRDHGNVIKAFDAMGRPAYPKRDEVAALRRATAQAPAETISIDRDGRIEIDVPAHGVALIEIDRTRK
jgi:xylan 1,4-beta-xylosidase